MPIAQHSTLKWLAAAVWYVGAAVLLWKGAGRLFAVAGDGAPQWSITAAILGFGLGVLQGRTVFRAVCVRNLRRIRALETPRPWQFFRPGFFLALAVMIGGAVTLSALADSGPVAGLAVAGVDWLIGFSLLVGGEAFWSRAPKPAYGRAEETAS